MSKLPMRVAMSPPNASRAKTGPADVVDALARALGELDGTEVDAGRVFLPRYRGVPEPASIERTQAARP
jgi:hypothetical protein